MRTLMAAVAVESVDELVTALESVRTSRSVRLVGMDGEDGIGKTTLAKALGPRLRAKTIHLDSLLEKDRGGFTDFIDVVRLAKEIEDVLASSPLVVVEGVCLLAVLRRINLRPDALIYVRRIASYGHWYSKNLLDPDPEDGDPVERLRRRDPPPLITEIVKYHCAFRPVAVADILYNRREP
jgi:hypothetical protein